MNDTASINKKPTEQHERLIDDLRQLHKYLWGEHFTSHEKYNAAFEQNDKEGMAKALCRTRAYADAADRLNDILQQNPKP